MKARHRRVGFAFALILVLSCGKSDPPRTDFDDESARQEPAAPPAPPVNHYPLDEFAGYFDLVEMDGEAGYAGYVRIVSSATELGYEVHPLLGAVNPAPTYTVLSPTERTTIARENAGLHQTHETADRKISVKYGRDGKRITIESEVCTPGLCTPITWVAVTPD